MLIYVCSLPNDRGPGRIPQLITDDPARIKKFTELWDRPGRAVYECVSPLKEHATRRALETVAALALLHINIDLRALATPRDGLYASCSNSLCAPKSATVVAGFM